MSKPFRAKKSLGQNFLVDPNYQRKIIEALDSQPGDSIVEIGPGTGALTHHLIGSVRSMTVIELDDALAAELERQYGKREDFQLIHADVMTVDFSRLDADKVVGNIPYNITSPLIFKLLERGARPRQILLMVQKEVADRIVAQPGGADYGALSIGVQSVAAAERVFNVPRGAFRPAPKVDSAVVRIVPQRPPALTAAQEADLRTLTRAAFSWRRKQLQNILRNAENFGVTPEELASLEAATGIVMTDRPEQIGPDRFIALARALRDLGYPAEATA